MLLVKFAHVIAISTVILALQVACTRVNTTKNDNKKSELFGKDITGTDTIELSLSDVAATARFAGNCYASYGGRTACSIRKEATLISGQPAKKNGSAAAPVIEQPAASPDQPAATPE